MDRNTRVGFKLNPDRDKGIGIIYGPKREKGGPEETEEASKQGGQGVDVLARE